MSKKLNSKKKVNIRLKPHESYIVATAEWFMQAAELYESLAKKEEDKDIKHQYVENAAFIRANVEQNYFDPSYMNDDDEDWN